MKKNPYHMRVFIKQTLTIGIVSDSVPRVEGFVGIFDPPGGYRTRGFI